MRTSSLQRGLDEPFVLSTASHLFHQKLYKVLQMDHLLRSIRTIIGNLFSVCQDFVLAALSLTIVPALSKKVY